MLEIEIQYGKAEDANRITDFLVNMVFEKENYGGYSFIRSKKKILDSIESEIRAKCAHQDYIYLLAIQESFSPSPVGMVAGNIEPLDFYPISTANLTSHLIRH